MAKKDTAKAVDFTPGDSLMVDFDSVEDISFDALPRGMYDCQIVECEFTYSQSSGNPMWTLQLEVTEGDYAGRKLYNHWVFAGKGLPITKRQLARVKPELMAGPFNPEDQDTISEMLGLEVKAKVSVRKWEGSDRNNVQDLYPADGGDGFMT